MQIFCGWSEQINTYFTPLALLLNGNYIKENLDLNLNISFGIEEHYQEFLF